MANGEEVRCGSKSAEKDRNLDGGFGVENSNAIGGYLMVDFAVAVVSSPAGGAARDAIDDETLISFMIILRKCL